MKGELEEEPKWVPPPHPRSLPTPRPAALRSVMSDTIMSQTPTVILGRYRLGRFLGQGSFAKVYEARFISDSTVVAVKIIDKRSKAFENAAMEPLVAGEIEAMRRLKRHPNILSILEVMATKTKIYLVMELAQGGELLKKIASRRNFLLKESDARRYFRQLVSALRFCHRNGVAHRDLKPQNLLLDGQGNLKVSDFGLSALPERASSDGMLRTACGTPAFTAPEVLLSGSRGSGYDGAKADAWSCGVILHVLLAGKLPFGNDGNIAAMCRKIKAREIDFPEKMSSAAKRLVYRLLDPNPATRLGVEQLSETSWYRRSMSMPDIAGSTASFGVETAEDGPPEQLLRSYNSIPVDRNAFEIISMSAGLDLSGLFEERRREERRFAAAGTTAEEAVERVRKAGERLGFDTETGKGGRTAAMGKGRVVVAVEAVEISEGLIFGGVKVVEGGGEFGDNRWEDLRNVVAGDGGGITWLNDGV